MNGLSAMGMERQETPMMEQGETAEMEQQEQGGVTVEDVINALLQGISPEELVKQGVPVELIKHAVEIMQSNVDGQSQPSQGGLSAVGMQ